MGFSALAWAGDLPGLVDAHGGRIWIVDGEQPGTTVAFTLPVSRRMD